MTKTIEVLDSLCGTGKSTAMLRYMAAHQDRPYLYVAPILEQTEERLPVEAAESGLDLFVPYDDKLYSKSDTALKALEEGKHISCTHNLMYKFGDKHLNYIKKNNYCVVSDEELNLINAYNIKTADIDFLIKNNIIKIEESDGKVVFLDKDMDLSAKYGDLKAKADLDMIYAARRSSKFLVSQISPKIIEASSRFILITYNYKNSLMETFLKLHGFGYKVFNEVKLYKTNEDVLSDLRERIEFVDTPSTKKVRENFPLTKSWWTNATAKDRNTVSKAIRSVMNADKTKRDDLFYTAPKDYCVKSKGFEDKFIGREPRLDDEGNPIESTRTFLACNIRSTNIYDGKTLAVHAYNLFPNQAVKAYIQGENYAVDDDVYALNMLIQWVYRGCIRKKDGGIMKVCILSKRMNVLFKEWLMKATNEVNCKD